MSRAWCITVHKNVYATFRRWSSDRPPVRALVAQIEFCPETGKPHIQGFVRLDKPARIRSVQTLLAIPGAHLEVAKGSDDDNIRYCSDRDKSVDREFEPIKFGEFSSQGKRTDLLSVFEAGKAGTLTLEESTLQVAARYGRFFDRCMALYKGPTIRQIEVIYIYGPTRSGKTFSVFEKYPDAYRLLSLSPEWWDGYSSQECVLFDDFRGGIPCHRILQILDPYPLQVPIKGGSRWLHATKFYITSNLPPWQLYEGVDNPTHDAWLARLNQICEAKSRSDLSAQGDQTCGGLQAPQTL